MKKIHKSLLIVAIAFVMVFGSVLTAQAETIMDAPVISNNTETSFTVTWKPVSGASYYELGYYPMEGDSGDIKWLNVGKKTSYTMKVPKDTAWYVAVQAFNSKKEYIAYSYYSALCLTKPSKKVTKVKAGYWTENSVELSLDSKYLPKYSTGMDYQILNSKGKRLKKGDFASWTQVTGLSAKNIYKLKVRPMIKLDNGKNIYGKWHTSVLVPQPIMNKLKIASGNKIKVSWKKVKGATKYVVYGSTNETKGYKKIKAVSGKKSSVVVSKVRGKKLQNYKNYYFKVVACKGKVKSDNSNYVSGYIYLTYK